MKSRKFSPFFLLLLLLLTVNVVASQGPIMRPYAEVSFNYSSFISAVNMSAVMEHVSFFSSLKTRATGYAGNSEAANYILRKFVEYGLSDVRSEAFSVVDCINYGANVTIIEENITIPLHPILPNLISPSTTPSQGFSGKLIYGGTGEIRDFEGKDIEGNIVLLEWHSGPNWINAAMLGAKAVIFLPPKPGDIIFSLYGVASSTSYVPSPVDKNLWSIPLNFPRFYVEEKDAQTLMLNVNRQVNLKSTHRWAEVISWNIIGFVKGKERPEGIIVLSSYYDSYSESPSVAPGAQESLGISVLLELAKYFAKPENKPPLTLMFVAFGGHHQSLAGARYFVDEYYFPASNATKRQIGERIWCVINLDFSTGSDYVLFTVDGNAFQGPGIDGDTFRDYGEKFDIVLRRYLSELESQVGQKYKAYIKVGYFSKEDLDATEIPNIMATKFLSYDHEVFNVLPYPPYAWSITTGYDPRPYYRTPFDTIEKINWENLRVQLECIYALLLRFVFYWSDFEQPTITFYWPHHGITGTGVGVGIIYGRVAVWDEAKGSWKVLTRSDFGSLTPLVFFRGSHALDRRFLPIRDDGVFIIKTCIVPTTKRSWDISVWIINPETGNIIFAPDQGRYRFTAVFSAVHKTEGEVREIDIPLFTVFNASTMAIIGLTSSVNLVKAEDLSPVTSYGVWYEDVGASRLYIVAVPPNEPILLPNFILSNADESSLLGRGFSIKPDTQVIIRLPILECAKDTLCLSKHYINRILSQGIDITGESFYLESISCEEKINGAYKALLEKEYSRAYVLAIEALSTARRVLDSVRSYGTQIIVTMPLLYLLAIPFVVLFEKMVFNQRGAKKALSLAGVMATLLMALYILHPGLSMSAYPLALLASFCVILTASLTLVIILRDVTSFMNEIRKKRIGVHEVKISRTELALYSFMTGVENMRKRKFRTTLVLVSVCLQFSSIICFVSLSPLTLEIPAEFGITTPMPDCILIRRFEWGHGNIEVGWKAIEYLVAKYSAVSQFIPVAWKYTLWPTFRSTTTNDIGFAVRKEQNTIYPKALLGLPPDARNIFSTFLLEGSRWFISGETRACILSEKQAKALNIRAENLPAEVIIDSMVFKVIGIMSDAYDLIKNIDGESLTPIKRDYPPGVENPWDEHLNSYEVLIVTYDSVICLGGVTAAVIIVPNDPSIVRSIGNEIQSNIGVLTNVDVYSSQKGEVFIHGEATRITLTGFLFQIIPMIVVSLILLNSILGSVHERRAEIKTYGTIGLSPLHVTFIFLGESLVYGILGAVIGYLLAMVQFRLYEALTGFQIANYGSNVAALAISLSIASTLASSLYPAYVSGKAVTPSLERAWKIPTKPIGELWDIPLPFLTSTKAETKGVMLYIYEFLCEHSIPDAPNFMTSNIEITEFALENKPAFQVKSNVRLAPYNIGITQESKIIAVEESPSQWKFTIILRKTSGPSRDWIRLNRVFIDQIRKQLLLWKTLSESERNRYITYA
ncbi:MAG: M28 family peptidase [Candidatus Bathyarchaeia archaeon]|nr:M28 family peptidase [Candidatus Bathyarchaeota archaeon]